MKYGRALRVLRAVVCMKQIELAEKVGCDGSYVALIEGERRVPSVEILAKFAKALGFPMYALTILASEETPNQKHLTRSEAEFVGKLILDKLRTRPNQVRSA